MKVILEIADGPEGEVSFVARSEKNGFHDGPGESLARQAYAAIVDAFITEPDCTVKVETNDSAQPGRPR